MDLERYANRLSITHGVSRSAATPSKNQIAESLGLDRKTVRKYLAPAEAEGLAPGGPAVSVAEWRERAAGWFPELADARLRQVTWGEIGKHHEVITGQLTAGVRVKTIHQRLCDEHGLAALAHEADASRATAVGSGSSCI